MVNNITKINLNEIKLSLKSQLNGEHQFINGGISDIVICLHPQNDDFMPMVIGRLLNKNHGYCLVCEGKDDGNTKNSFKNFLLSTCRKYKPLMVLDLTSTNEDCQVSLVSDYGKTLLDDTLSLSSLITSFNKYGIEKVITDGNFSGNTNLAQVVSEKLSQKALQIEINEGYANKSTLNIIKIVNAIHLFCQILRKRNEVMARFIDIPLLREIDQKFATGQGLNDFEYVNSIDDIVLSAPHAKQSVFNGKVKASESMTGSICKLFNTEFGFSVIYKTKDNQIDYFNTQANQYKDTLIKKVIKPDTKLFLELHTLSQKRVQDVTLFLPENYDKEKLYQIINALNNHGLQYFSINSVFDSYKKHRTINQIKNNCFKLQICFNERLYQNDETLSNVTSALKEIISIFLD